MSLIEDLPRLRKDLLSYRSDQAAALTALRCILALPVTPQDIKASKLVPDISKLAQEAAPGFQSVVAAASELRQKWKSVYNESKLKEKKAEKPKEEDTKADSNIQVLRRAMLLNAEDLESHPKFEDFLSRLDGGLKRLGKQQRLHTLRKTLASKNTEYAAKVLMVEGLTAIDDIISCRPEVFSRAQEELQKAQEQKILENLDVDFWAKKKRQIHSEGKGIKCRFCKKPTASITNMLQIRASDEPMTVFYRCYGCDRNWKQ